MKPFLRTAASCAAAAVCLAVAGPGAAQVTLRPDGQWRYLLTAGANATSGNSDSLALNLSAEAARVRSFDKWTATGLIAYGRNDGTVNTERAVLSTQYNRDLSPRVFAFSQIGALRDEPANVSSRFSLSSGLGRHLVQREESTFDVSAGLGYSLDHYSRSREVIGQQRDSYGRLELVLAEESSHRLSTTTSFRQRLAAYPNLRDSGNFRATFDAGVSVAITATLALTAGLNYRHDSDPGLGLKRGDTSLVTGVSFRFD